MNTQNNSIQFKDIIKYRRQDLQREMELKPLNVLKDEIESYKLSKNLNPGSDNQIDIKDLKHSLDQGNDVAVICEFKPASPSMGDISNSKLDDALKIFVKSGASAVSILTEKRHFKGSLNNLRSAYNITKLPIIRKDFIINQYQIYQAKIAGASSVLLMNNIYPDLEEGISICRELDMNPIVECKNKEEIFQSLKVGADIIGINNRNFNDFSINLETTAKLAQFVPSNVILVSESGIKGPEDANYLSSFGVDALLIGTSIMGVKGDDAMLKAATNIISSVKGSRIVRNEG
jgi:indole-3-glycerol phosphate synthase